MTGAMKHAMKHVTLFEEEYPYNAQDNLCEEGHKEKESKSPLHHLGGFNSLKPDSDCSNLKKELMLAPVSIGVNADKQWFSYKSGVITKCSSKHLNHGIVAIGFGTDA